MRVICPLAVTAVLALAGPALAQPALTRSVEPPEEPRSDEPVKAKQPRTARVISIAVPLATSFVGLAMTSSDSDVAPVGGVIFLGGIIVGPASGLWYGGHLGGVGIAVRSVAAVVAFGATLDLVEGNCGHGGGDPTECERRERIVGGFLVAALGTLLASAIYDIHAAGEVTEAWNRKRGLVLAPTLLPSSRGPAAGAALSLRF